MDQIRDCADDRLLNGCLYCGSQEPLTREHAPSKVLLEDPLPENLPIVRACRPCNGGFSDDETYLACLLSVVLSGSSNPASQVSERARGALQHNVGLRESLEASSTREGGNVSFRIDPQRVQRVLVKLARGHAAFELSQPLRTEPTRAAWFLLADLSNEQRRAWESPVPLDALSEVGSRSLQRALVLEATLRSAGGEEVRSVFGILDWTTVQDNVYRYFALEGPDEISVRIVLREYLAAELVWKSECAAG